MPKKALDEAAEAALDCFHTCPSLDLLVPALVEGGVAEMQRRCSLTPGACRASHKALNWQCQVYAFCSTSTCEAVDVNSHEGYDCRQRIPLIKRYLRHL